ncbi:MAG: cysteine--tRNA ligase [Candidatus Paceibacterota bacterium]
MITFWNTLTKQKEEFFPIKDKVVGMYNCGPTVYDYAHLGNLRSYVLADILKRTLTFNKYRVNQIINITDVGHLVGDGDEGKDKIEEGAKKQQKTASEIASFYTEAFLADLKKLNINTDEISFPRASEHIKEQINLIKTLEERGFAYKTSDGMYFDTAKFRAYGKLGNIDLAHLREGARVTINSQKKNITDFALWKFSQPHEKRQQEWPSPWGLGFPGWHIECSAMSMKYLGETFDIHTGGIDHIPTHHNNEIAQSESATGKQYVRYWLHNAFVNVEGGKMAKSEGNFLRLQSIIDKNINPLSYRYWLLTAHYRQPVTFSWEALESANVAFMKLARAYSTLPGLGKVHVGYLKKFKDFINDDLDTPQAVALIWEMMKDKSVTDRQKRATLNEFDKVLGLNLKGLAKELKNADKDVPDVVKSIVSEREKARKNKDWKKSDELRDAILKEGFEVKDTDKGAEVRRI